MGDASLKFKIQSRNLEKIYEHSAKSENFKNEIRKGIKK